MEGIEGRVEGMPTPPLGSVGTDEGNDALAPPDELLLEELLLDDELDELLLDELLLDDELDELLLEGELGVGMLGTEEEDDCDGV